MYRGYFLRDRRTIQARSYRSRRPRATFPPPDVFTPAWLGLLVALHRQTKEMDLSSLRTTAELHPRARRSPWPALPFPSVQLSIGLLEPPCALGEEGRVARGYARSDVFSTSCMVAKQMMAVN
ncbi:hypothetical protein B0H11DRAFT_2218974 [Mycena galericulata]|nr:hypothetical protein B0H11DRAFT_2218974 [Mycena galericulata]